MYRWVLFAAAIAVAHGADEQQIALVARAESAFDRVQLSAAPEVRDAGACIQAEAALLPIAPAEDQSQVYFRKGYCTLAEASVTHSAAGFLSAAADFDRAMGAWSARATRNRPLEPMPPALLILAAIARLEAAPSEEATDLASNQIRAALANASCPSNLMSMSFCQGILGTGREWLGWFALVRNNLEEAAARFSESGSAGWIAWVSGRKAFSLNDFHEAARQYRRAIPLLDPETPTSLAARLGPPADHAAQLTDLGGAELLAGEPSALTTLDAAVKAEPSARAIYLRGRAKEAAHQAEAALADYNLASRTAFAHSQGLASGEGHLYRGILLYRRRDYLQAEDEFSSALNFDIPSDLRADASAWRHLAAVAAGSCEASRPALEKSMAAASPYFPREEARSAVARCLSAVTGSQISPGPGSGPGLPRP